MSAPIGPGDTVEFYKLWRGTPIPDWCPLVLGGTYVIRTLTDVTSWPSPSEPGCLLEGICALPPGDAREHGFPLQCFRPIRRPHTELFRSLLQPSPEKVNELA